MALNKDFKVKNGATITQDLSVGGNAYLNALTGTNATFTKLTATEFEATSAIFTRTIVTSTSALSVINNGTGPALYVRQKGASQPIAEFVDQEGGVIYFADSGNLGINTPTPNEKLTVKGNISATGFINGLSLSATSTNGGFVSAGRDLADIFATSAAAGSVCGSGTTDRLAKWSGTSTLANSIARENSTQLTVAGNLSASGGLSATKGVGHFACNVGIGNNRPEQKLTVAGNISACGGLSASNGPIYFACRVGIGTIAPEAPLHVNAAGGILSQWHRNGTQLVTIGGSSNKGQIRFQYSGDCISTGASTGGDYRIDTGGSVGAGDNMFYVCKAGNVGIGTTAPAEKLTVAGNVSACGGLSATEMNSYFGCYVGIGTNNPGKPLHVNDDDSVGGICVTGASLLGTFERDIGISGLCVSILGSNADPQIRYNNGTKCWAAGVDQSADSFVIADGGEIHTGDYKLEVGTGQTTIHGNVSACGSLSAGLGEHFAACNSSYGGFISGGRDLADIFATSSGNVDGSGTAGFGAQWSDSDTLTDSLLSGGTNMTRTTGSLSATTDIYAGGNVGIGTTDPEFKLTIDLTEADNGIRITTNNGARHAMDLLAESGTNGGGDIKLYDWCGVNTVDARFRRDTSYVCSNFGIDTSSPNEKLTVAGNISATGNANICGLSATGASNYFSGKVGIGVNTNALGARLLYVNGYTAAGGVEFLSGVTYTTAVRVCSLEDKTSNAYSKIVFGAANCNITFNTDATNQMLINATGDVGIGTTSPNQKLTVSGNVSALGSLSAGLGEHVAVCNSSYGGFISGGRDLADIFGLGNINGSGTANYLPVFSDSDTIGNSIACQTCTLLTVAGNVCATGGLSASGNIKAEPTRNISFATTCADKITLGRVAANRTAIGLDTAGTTYTNAMWGIENNDGNLNIFRHGLDVLNLQNNGYVGIGGTPTLPFEVFESGTLDVRFRSAGGDSVLILAAADSTVNNSILKFGDNDSSNVGLITYAHNGDSMRFTTNATEQMRILSSGNVGIGTTNPYAYDTTATKLHVINSGSCGSVSEVARFQGSSDADGSGGIIRIGTSNDRGIYLEGGRTGSVPYASIGTTEYDGAKTEGIHIDSTGCVGIGTNTPAAPFHVKSTTSNTKMRLTNDNSTNWDFTVGNCGYYQGNLFISNPAISNEQFTLGSTGNVGINIFNPGQRLTVGGNISATGSICTAATTNGFVSAGRDLADIFETCSSSVDGSGTANFLPLWSDSDTLTDSLLSGGSAMTRTTGSLSATTDIYAGGDVGIGTTTPSQKLDVAGAVNIQDGYTLRYNNSSNISILGSSSTGLTYTSLEHHFKAYDGSSSYPEYMTIDTGGNVGIGATAPGSILELQGDGGNNKQLRLASGSSAVYWDIGRNYNTGHFEITEDSGSTYFLIDKDNGKVGIGTTAPNEKLTVAGNISATGNANICGLSATGTNNYFSGNVGIGDTTPTYKLDVNGTGRFTGHLDVQSTSDFSGALRAYGKIGVGNGRWVDPGQALTVAGNISACGGLSATEMNSYFGCNVGIGTNRPSSLLNLNDANNGDAHQLTFSYESGGTKTDAFTIGRNSSTGNLEFQSDINNHGFEFCHAAAGTQEFNVINMDVGIGTTTPNEKLTVHGNLSSCGDIRTKCGTVEGKVLYARNCIGASLMTAQYLSNLGEACIQSGCYGCVRLGTSQGWGMTLSANNDNVARVGIGGTIPGDQALTVQGNISATGCLLLPDAGQIRLGNTGDLVIQHDGANSYITEQGTGDLYIQPNSSALYVRDAVTGNVMIAAKAGSGRIAELYAGGNVILRTAGAGIDVFGTVTASRGLTAHDGLSARSTRNGIVSAGRDLADIFATSSGNVDGSGTAGKVALWSDTDTIGDSPISSFGAGVCVCGDLKWNGNATNAGNGNVVMGTGCIKFADDGRIAMGDSNDLLICHSGSHSIICENGTGGLKIMSGDLYLRTPGDVDMIYATSGGAAKLYYDGSEKLATTCAGIDVTGTITSSGGHVTNGDLTVHGSISAQGYCSVKTNTTFGTQALNDTSGGQNTAIGLQAMLANTCGYQNVAVGEAALGGNTEGLRNVAVGCGAAYSNTTGDNNVAIGCKAGYSNQTSNAIVAIGTDALYNNLAAENVAVGTCAGYGNTTGVQNVAMGHRAMCSNTIGTCNVAIGFNALMTSVTACGNVAVGNHALCKNTCGEKNVAVGDCALQSNTEAWYNVAVGYAALQSNTTGEHNIAIGRQPLNANTTGTMNIAIGRQSMWCNTDGDCNTAVGVYAMNGNTTGDFNQSIGHSSMYNNKTGDYNNAMGFQSLHNANSAYHNNAFGYHALYSSWGGNGNQAVGRDTLACTTIGSCNDAMGYRAMFENTTGCHNVGIGCGAMHSNTTACYNVAIGADSLKCNETGSYNTAVGSGAIGAGSDAEVVRTTAIGYNALYNQEYGQNTGVGYYAQRANTTGYYNTSIGDHALEDNQTGHNNTAVGWCALHENEASNNTAVGMYAALCNTTGTYNVAMGICALRSNTTGDSNVALGLHTLYSNKTGHQNVALGNSSLYLANSGDDNFAAGLCALYNNWGGCDNTAIGYKALCCNTTGDSNIGIGDSALRENETGDNNIAIGADAGKATTSTGSTFIGHTAGAANTTGGCNTALGCSSFNRNTTGGKNTSLGACSLFSNTVGSNNVAVGYHSLLQATTATQNIAVGQGTLYSNFHGDANVAIGMQALYSNKCSYNVAVGDLALNAQTTGYYNTAVGALASRCNLTGTVNTAVGMYALHKNTTASRNTAVGYAALICNECGGDNTAVGTSALYKNTAALNTAVGGCALICQTTGGCNVAMGYHAMFKNCDGIKNVGIGVQAMCAGSGGDYNTAVGYQANRLLTTGTTNSVFGYQAMYYNTTGCSNVALGSSTLYSNATGGCLVAVGNSALYNNTTESFSTAVGYEALYGNIDGEGNTAVGFRAGCCITSSNNTAIGCSALRQTCAGGQNTAIGAGVMYTNTTGTQNTAVGYNAMFNNCTGIGNAGFGQYSLHGNTTGCYNAGVGLNAGCNNTDGDCNVFHGYAAGRYLANGSTNLTSPDNSTYIGACTRGAAVGDNNVTVIGHCACACGDNTVSIGNCNVTNTYINGTTTINGDVCANNGYFCCVIAGGYFEQKAANDTLACYPTGTLVVIGECGDLIQSTKENDKKVFGVTQNGACQPIVLGAEPVLVTGNIKIGDYITTSDKPGHGRKTRDPVYGSVIAQSMEAGTGNSHLVKAMIRKM